MKRRYEVIGIPVGAAFSVLDGHRVGDVIEADLDPDVERLLIGSRALQPLPDLPKPAKSTAKVDEKAKADDGATKQNP